MVSPIPSQYALIVKSPNCTDWPQNEIERYNFKVKCKFIRESQISLRFVLRSLVFQIIEVSGFFLGAMVSFRNYFVKITHPKFQKSPTLFWEDHWEENSWQVWKFLSCRRSNIWKSHYQKSRKHLSFFRWNLSHWSMMTLLTPRPGQAISYNNLPPLLPPPPPPTHTLPMHHTNPAVACLHRSMLIRRRTCHL